MTRYFFAIRGTDQEGEDDHHGTILSNDAEAFSYAERRIAQLKKKNGYDHPGMIMIVQNTMREMIWSIPILPGYA